MNSLSNDDSNTNSLFALYNLVNAKRVLIYFLLLILTTAYGLAAYSDRSFNNTELERYKVDVSRVLIPERTPKAPINQENLEKKGQG